MGHLERRASAGEPAEDRGRVVVGVVDHLRVPVDRKRRERSLDSFHERSTCPPVLSNRWPRASANFVRDDAAAAAHDAARVLGTAVEELA